MPFQRTRSTCIAVLTLALVAGCQSNSEHKHHRHADDQSVPPPPPPARPAPPPIGETRQQFIDQVEPQLATKIVQRLDASHVKQKLVLAVAMPPDDADPVAAEFFDRLKADHTLTDDFEIVASYAAASDELPPKLAPPPHERAPDGSEPQRTVYDPEDIYVLSLHYTESTDDGDLVLTLKCRLTHPQTRELNLQISPTARQIWDGSAWRLTW